MTNEEKIRLFHQNIIKENNIDSAAEKTRKEIDKRESKKDDRKINWLINID